MLIVHFLESLFKLYYTNKILSSDKIMIYNNEYWNDIDSNTNIGFIGFFDWLRADKNTIIGLRLCFFENQYYNDLLKSLSYVHPTFDNKCMELFFGENTYDPNLSDDQDFTNNYVFKSENNEYLFTFGLDHLTTHEFESLLKYCTVLNDSEIKVI